MQNYIHLHHNKHPYDASSIKAVKEQLSNLIEFLHMKAMEFPSTDPASKFAVQRDIFEAVKHLQLASFLAVNALSTEVKPVEPKLLT